MGRSKKFMLNSVTTALLQVVTMIAGFITPRFMLTAYGSEINGLISSILQFISYFQSSRGWVVKCSGLFFVQTYRRERLQ